MELNKLNNGINELTREYQARLKAYPIFVAQDKLTKKEADERIENLSNAIAYLVQYKEVLVSLIEFEK